MSEDSDLAAIRSKRMQEMQQMQQMKGQQEKEQETRQNQEAAMQSILNQVMDQEARARLNTISVAKPEKGKQLEAAIINMATSGRIGGKLGESDLIQIVESLNAQTKKTNTVKFDRRRVALDSDDSD